MNKIDYTWNSSDPYEYFMGRWSRLMAPVFLGWLKCPPNLGWLDLGCGTGALSEAIIKHCRPARLTCVDPSPGFLRKAQERLPGIANFFVGTATAIPGEAEMFNAVASGLARAIAVKGMKR